MITETRITVTGATGQVRWGYHLVAEVGAWTLSKGLFSATVQNVDTAKLSQAPLSFVVVRPNGSRWEWPMRDVSLLGSILTARLEEQEA